MSRPPSVGDDALLPSILDAVERAADRCRDLIDRAPDPEQPVRGLDWTVRVLATHLALGPEIYRAYTEGETTPAVDVTDIAGGSLADSLQAVLDTEPKRELPELAERLRTGTKALVDACSGRAGSDRVMWHGQPASVVQMLAIQLNEFLVHGDDLARTIGQAWRIDPDDASLSFHHFGATMPIAVNPRTAAGVNVRVELRVRGGPSYVLCIDDGIGRIGEADERVDCVMSVDPVAFLLVGYGRRPMWRAALTGKMLVWGRKPWAAAAFQKHIVTP